MSPSRAVGAAAYNLDWRQNREPMENEAESVCAGVSLCAHALCVCTWCVHVVCVHSVCSVYTVCVRVVCVHCVCGVCTV